MKIYEVLYPMHTISSKWYVHFFKEPLHGKQIMHSGFILPGSDGIVWAIPQGNGYDESQVETDYDTGVSIQRAGAIVFSAFDKPTPVRKIVGWDQKVELENAYLVSVKAGVDICNNRSISSVDAIMHYYYGDNNEDI